MQKTIPQSIALENVSTYAINAASKFIARRGKLPWSITLQMLCITDCPMSYKSIGGDAVQGIIDNVLGALAKEVPTPTLKTLEVGA